MTWAKRSAIWVLVLAAVLFAPLLVARLEFPPLGIEEIAPADAALVFGALVRNQTISPLHEERLNAAKDLYDRGLVGTIVLSNSSRAARAMEAYMLAHGVPGRALEIDGHAENTPDTCRNEAGRDTARRVIFVSQSFHIPRLARKCAWLGIRGQALAAERYRSANATRLPFWRVAEIRGRRYVREAALLWLAYLGLYERL